MNYRRNKKRLQTERPIATLRTKGTHEGSDSGGRALRFEALEIRAMLAVGPIPSVPVPEAYWMFDDGSGSVAVDSSGNGHNATLDTGASWTAGNVGTDALLVDGSANGVATATGPVVDTSSDFTVSAWVNLASLSGFQTVVSIAGSNVAGFFLQLRGDTGKFAFTRLSSDAVGGATYVSANAAPEIDTWYHLVGVNDSVADTLTLYVDGQSMGSVAYANSWQATGDTLIGHGFYNGGNVDYVDGAIDEVQLFSSALSAAQVVALDQPAAYSFDDGTGTTAADVSGHGNTLNLNTGASWAAGHLGSNSLSVDGTATGNATYSSSVLDTSLPFSVSAWVNLASLAGSQTFASIDGSAVSAFYLQYRADTSRFAFARFDSDSTAATFYRTDSIDVPTTGQWYNLIGVNDVANSELRLYVDGVLQNTVTYSSGWQGVGPTVVGGGLYGGSRTDYVDGQIDDVRFYNSPLSDSAALFIGTAGESVIDIDTGSMGIAVSPLFYGAFMEDINYGGEGGIYSNEVRNSGFNDSTNPLNAWAAVTDPGVAAVLTSDDTTGPTSALTKSGMLTIASGVNAGSRAGISNSGYFGVAVEPSTTYTAEFYAKASAGFTGPLTVSLESNGGTVYASATVASITSDWTKYVVELTTSAGAPTSSNNKFIISTNSASANGETIWFGATYLFPPGYGGGDNHFRSDLMQWLVDLHPAFFRVPGGNYLEGVVYEDRFNWSETIGPIEDRPGHYNSAWGYWSTDGFGLDEYLQMAELVGAEPIIGLFDGYTLNGSSSDGKTLTDDLVDGLNQLHYVLDPVTTTWGALRAANGHPEPYELNFVEIGNEDWASDGSYATRYPMFYNAIKAEFPDLKIIAATNANTGNRPYDVYDDHFYNSAQWFAANSDYYDNHPRDEYEVIIGEYAAREGAPTPTVAAALGEAAFLMGAERNSDVVTMTAYAPLWVNENSWQWNTDLIGFDNNTSYASPSFYVQQMLSHNRGTHIVSDSLSSFSGLQTLVTRTDTTYYLTVVNTSGSPSPTTINLVDALTVSPSATVTTLSASVSNAVNSLSNPTNVAPATSTLSGLGTSFSYAFPGYSLTIIEFDATADAPTIATPAAASPSTVTGTSTNLSVLGDATVGESNLIYTWSALGPADISFSANGSNASKNTTATFSEAGVYEFSVSIEDTINGISTATSVTVTVDQVSAGVTITPGSATVAAGSTAQLTAFEIDQFGDPMASQPEFTWSVISGAGSVSSTGFFTAAATAGASTVHVDSVSGSADANLSIVVPETWYQADATSGTTLADSSGNGNDGSIVGSASWVSGVSGNSLSLEGGSVVLPTGIVSSLNDFTIATWVNLDSLNAWSRIFDFGSGTGTYMFLTPQANGTNGPLRFAITTSGGGSEQIINGPVFEAGKWIHVAVTLSGNIGTLYIDGVAVGTNDNMTLTPSALGATTQNYLGDSQYSADPALLGQLDDFRIYDTALTVAQIKHMARPLVAAPISAGSVPAATTPTAFSILGEDQSAGESALVYSWSTVGYPPAPVTFSANGSNAAKDTTVTFQQPGVYYLEATITNPITGLSTENIVSVAVSTKLPGDYNLDGFVSGLDFLSWQRQIGDTVPAFTGADGNGDTMVDGYDLDVWETNYEQSSVAASVSIVPVEEEVAVAATIEKAPQRANVWITGTALNDTTVEDSTCAVEQRARRSIHDSLPVFAIRDKAINSWLPRRVRDLEPVLPSGHKSETHESSDFDKQFEKVFDRVFEAFDN